MSNVIGVLAQSASTRPGLAKNGRVKTHIGRLLGKLEVGSRVQAALMARSAGMDAGPRDGPGSRPG